jgi:hypothetical protein
LAIPYIHHGLNNIQAQFPLTYKEIKLSGQLPDHLRLYNGFLDI